MNLDRWLILLLLSVFGSMVALAFAYSAEARLVPLTVGSFGVALCLLQLAFDVGGSRRLAAYFHAAPKLGRPNEIAVGLDEAGATTLRQEMAVWGYFLGFVAAVLVVGFYVAVSAMLFFYLWRQARVIWPRALVASVSATAAMHLVFGQALGFALFPGFAITAALQLLSR